MIDYYKFSAAKLQIQTLQRYKYQQMSQQEFLPLLKPQNIEQLKNLILEIMLDNDSKLQKTIQNHQNQAVERNQQFTLDNLNDILMQQCLQKQKIITNLSHFALSLMNTIKILWQDNEDLQYKINDQRQMLSQMNQNIQEITKQNDYFKNKLQISYNDFHKLQQQKQAVQAYFNALINKYETLQVKKNESYSQSMRSKSCQNLFHFQQQQDILNEQKTQKQNNFKKKILHSDDDECEQNIQAKQKNLQTSISFIKKQQKNIQQTYQNECCLLEQSIIKDSISVLRRFTLQDQAYKRQFIQEMKQKVRQEEQSSIKFISKSRNFSLINQISLQICEQPQPLQPIQTNNTNIYSKINTSQVSVEVNNYRELKMANQKINITIATGTQFTKGIDSSHISQAQQNQLQIQSNIIHESPSCGSFILNRQNSAIMYPSFQKSSSTLNFVSHSTKQIQANFDDIKKGTRLQFKKSQKRSTGVDTGIQKRLQKQKKQQQLVNKQRIIKQKSIQDNQQSKSLSQLIGYFTKKIVSDRIKATNKKNDIAGFKKSKTNIVPHK